MLKKLRDLFRNKYVLMVLRLTVAGLFLWWVLKGIRFSELTKLTWRGVLTGLVSAEACVVLQVACTALRWRMLLKGQGIPISVFRAVSLTFQGNMFSLFMPGGAVGGDVLKAAFLTQETREGKKIEGVTTIFLDRVIGMMGLFLLVILSGIGCLKQILTFDPEIRLLVWIMLLVCCAGLLAGLVLLFQDIFLRIRLLAFLVEKADSAMHGALSRILASVKTCRQDSKTLVIAFLGSFLILHPMLIFSAFLVMLGVSGKFPPFLAGFLSFSLGSTASVAPFTPGGLGTRDKVIEVMLQSFGFAPGTASLMPVLYSIVLIFSASLGVVFFLLDMGRSRGAQANKETADRK